MARTTICIVVLVIAAQVNAEPINAAKTAVFYNNADDVSKQVKDYYVQFSKRNIPASNIKQVTIPLTASISSADFNNLIGPHIASLPPTINAIVITWARPYRVMDIVPGQDPWLRKQMSITAAFTFGTGPDYFKGRPGQLQCVGVNNPPNPNDYPISPFYDAPQSEYYQALGRRMSMMLAARWYEIGENPDAAVNATKALIDRGKASDLNNPVLRALLVRAANDLRSGPREADFGLTEATYPPGNPLGDPRAFIIYWNNDDNQLGKDWPQCQGADPDYDCGAGLMAFETGHWCIPDIRDNNGAYPFLPGAFASHLTSEGGVLDTPNVCGTGPEQMTILRWIEAGVTGTSGTVREPCNFEEKFHEVNVLMEHYLAKERLIEAQWKSVKIPYELLFVGEPLAIPYKTKATILPGP